jgi:hypothetical protein
MQQLPWCIICLRANKCFHIAPIFHAPLLLLPITRIIGCLDTRYWNVQGFQIQIGIRETQMYIITDKLLFL